MRNQADMLTELQCADAILARAGRERPCGYRSSLNTARGGIEPSIGQIKWALIRASAVEAIVDRKTRRVVSLAMATLRGDPAYSRRGIAEAIGISQPTVTRKLKSGLASVAKSLRAGRAVSLGPERDAILTA